MFILLSKLSKSARVPLHGLSSISFGSDVGILGGGGFGDWFWGRLASGFGAGFGALEWLVRLDCLNGRFGG